MAYLLEHWKSVVDYEGIYEISNVGNIRRIMTSKGEAVYRPLRPSMGGTAEYYKINLRKDGILRTHSVHKLVAEAFLGECPSGYTVHHKNEYKVKNWVSNMDYITRADNIKLSFVGSKSRRGASHCRAILVEDDIRRIRLLALTKTPTEIAKELNADPSHIGKIIRGDLWKHVA